MDIEKELKELIEKTLAKSISGDSLKELAEINLDVPRDRRFGDFATNIAFVLSQKKKNLPAVAVSRVHQALCAELKGSALEEKIEKIELKGGGFINFYLSKSYLYEILSEISIKNNKFGGSNLGGGRKVHLEFVSANPTGPLNVAHGRQAAFGDSLANILDFCGYKASREYYLNDEGVQIDLLGESVRVKYLELLGIAAQFPDSGYKGEYIEALAQGLVEKYGRRLADGSEKRRKFFCFYAMRKILKEIEQDLKNFGVRYDFWYSQRKLGKTGRIAKAIELLKKKDFIYPKEGAWWLASSKFGDDKDRVVIKSDLKLTYIAPDIAYHQTKFKRGFVELINIWGPDHHGYIPRIKAAVSALGYDAKRLHILIVQFVSLVSAEKIIPMSTRKGQYITLAQVLQAVGKDAARFFFLMRKRDAHLQFDLELAKKQSLENPVYYIQYAHARTLNILKFAKSHLKINRSLPKDLNLSLLDKPEELNLIQTLREFPAAVKSCALSLEPHRIAAYLQELAKGFHHYYEKYRVVTQDKKLSCARVVLVDATRVVLNNGLRLLAISAPEKM